MAAKEFTGWEYTSDQDEKFVIRVADYISSQLDIGDEPKIGGQTRQVGQDPLPIGFKPRFVKMWDSVSKTSRSVTVFDTSCYLWVTDDATLQLNVGQPPVLTVFTKYGSGGERRREYRS